MLARPEPREARREGAFVHDCIVELERRRIGCIHERIRAADTLAVDIQCQLGELAGFERDPRRVDFQAQQPVGPARLRDDSAFEPWGHGRRLI